MSCRLLDGAREGATLRVLGVGDDPTAWQTCEDAELSGAVSAIRFCRTRLRNVALTNIQVATPSLVSLCILEQVVLTGDFENLLVRNASDDGLSRDLPALLRRLAEIAQAGSFCVDVCGITSSYNCVFDLTCSVEKIRFHPTRQGVLIGTAKAAITDSLLADYADSSFYLDLAAFRISHGTTRILIADSVESNFQHRQLEDLAALRVEGLIL